MKARKKGMTLPSKIGFGVMGVFIAGFTVTAFVDSAFKLGWGHSWKDVFICLLMALYWTLLYFLVRWLQNLTDTLAEFFRSGS